METSRNPSDVSREFWHLVRTCAPHGEEPDSASIRKACDLLNEAIPHSHLWVPLDRSDGTTPVLFWLLWSLWCYNGEDGGPTQVSPKIMAFPLDKVTLYLGVEAFREAVFNEKPAGTIPFFFNICSGQIAFRTSSNAKEHMHRLVKRGTWLAYDYQGVSRQAEHQCYVECYGDEGAALCFVRGTELIVYALPPSWIQVMEEVGHDLRSMTAREKGIRSLSFSLQQLVTTCGRDNVAAAFEKIE